MTITEIYTLIKEIIEDVQHLSDRKLANSILEKLLSLQAEMLEIRSVQLENIETINALKKQLEAGKRAERITWHSNGVGTYIDSNNEKHHVCQHCYEKEGKLYEIPFSSDGGRCPECSVYFINKF